MRYIDDFFTTGSPKILPFQRLSTHFPNSVCYYKKRTTAVLLCTVYIELYTLSKEKFPQVCIGNYIEQR